MRLKNIIFKAAVIIALAAVVWFCLGKFNIIAKDNYGSGQSERSARHESIENI